MVSWILPSPPSPLSSLLICSTRDEISVSYCSCRDWFKRDLASKWRTVIMRDRGKNRKPLQKGRNLSSEAIQAIQALKRARKSGGAPLEVVLESKIRRLLKIDMMAVLGELQRQDESFLALEVFEEIRKEQWYKPNLSVYVDLIAVLERNGSLEDAERVCSYLMRERWDPDINGFNRLFRTLLDFGRVHITMSCYRLMKLWEIDPEEETFRILILGLESMAEMEIAGELRQEAQKYFGSLDFLSEDLFSDISPQSHQ